VRRLPTVPVSAFVFPLVLTSLGVARAVASGGWQDLLGGRGLSGWSSEASSTPGWFITGEVRAGLEAGQAVLHAQPGPGPVLVNAIRGAAGNLVSRERFGDHEIHLEFLVPKYSNSGVYVHGLYEIQIKDSFGISEPSSHDCGAVYQRWIEGRGVGGRPPSVNASRPAGEWQSFDIRFQAPRFDAGGRKTANARFLEVVHNGLRIHTDVELDGPTRAAMELPEASTNPLMLQGDHGPVAFRSIRVRRLQ